MQKLQTAPPLSPHVELPADPRLRDFTKLFSGEWVWSAYCSLLGEPEDLPRQLHLRQLSYNPRRSAIATYVADWPWDDFVTEKQFAVELAPDHSVSLFSYPQDPHLPGLAAAASSIGACNLLNTYVYASSVQRVRVSSVRYRPGGHAVLRHRHGQVRFYVRVMRPTRVSRLMRAAKLVEHTAFVLPRLAGSWPEGGVVWLSEIPGKNVRRLIRKGVNVEVEPILENLAQLWDTPLAFYSGRPFNLYGAYRRARRVFRQVLQDWEGPGLRLKEATASLDGFAKTWQPRTIAHNDFYDDQMIRLTDGRIALVDFEEAGHGDPLLDVGNLLAHMRWSARFGRETESKASSAFHHLFRSAALERFGWDERALNQREAICIFRVCTNPIRHLAPNWLERLDTGLTLVNELLA